MANPDFSDHHKLFFVPLADLIEILPKNLRKGGWKIFENQLEFEEFLNVHAGGIYQQGLERLPYLTANRRIGNWLNSKYHVTRRRFTFEGILKCSCLECDPDEVVRSAEALLKIYSRRYVGERFPVGGILLLEAELDRLRVPRPTEILQANEAQAANEELRNDSPQENHQNVDLPLLDDGPPPAKMARFDSPPQPQLAQETLPKSEATADKPFNAIRCCKKCKNYDDKSVSVSCGRCFHTFHYHCIDNIEEEDKEKLYICRDCNAHFRECHTQPEHEHVVVFSKILSDGIVAMAKSARKFIADESIDIQTLSSLSNASPLLEFALLMMPTKNEDDNMPEAKFPLKKK